MSQEKIRKIHLIYGWITAALILIVAVGLIVSCAGIYQSGDRPFSREVVAAALQNLAIPGWLCLAAVVGAVVLHIALPLDVQKTKGIRSDYDTLLRYRTKYAELPPDQQQAINKEKRLRRIFKIVTAVIIAALAVYPITYFADVSHFSVTDITSDVVKAVTVVLIPTAAALILVYICGRLCAASIHREIEIYKCNSIKPGKAEKKSCIDQKALTISRIALITVAVVLIIMGIANDGVADVLGKAIRICTECIGLG